MNVNEEKKKTAPGPAAATAGEQSLVKETNTTISRMAPDRKSELRCRVTNQPGVMLYFDLAAPLKALTYEDRGRMFDAILEYCEHGVVPEFTGQLSMAWEFIRPSLDRDAKKYREKVIKNTYNSYVGKVKHKGLHVLEFDEWLKSEGIDREGYQLAPTDVARNPTSTSPAYSFSSSVTNPRDAVYAAYEAITGQPFAQKK